MGREEALADAEVPKAGGDTWRQVFLGVVKLAETRHAVGEPASVEGHIGDKLERGSGCAAGSMRANVKPPSEANFRRGLSVSRPWPGLFCLPSCSGQPGQDFLQGLQGTCRDVPSGREPRYRR